MRKLASIVGYSGIGVLAVIAVYILSIFYHIQFDLYDFPSSRTTVTADSGLVIEYRVEGSWVYLDFNSELYDLDEVHYHIQGINGVDLVVMKKYSIGVEVANQLFDKDEIAKKVVQVIKDADAGRYAFTYTELLLLYRDVLNSDYANEKLLAKLVTMIMRR